MIKVAGPQLAPLSKSALRKEVKNLIRGKAKSSNCRNYVLLTDVPLTAQFRDELVKEVRTAGFCKLFCIPTVTKSVDCLTFIRKVRRSFPQLLGLADLDQIVHSDIYNRSKAFFEHWSPALATFVRTGAYLTALDKIQTLLHCA